MLIKRCDHADAKYEYHYIYLINIITVIFVLCNVESIAYKHSAIII